MRAAGRVEPETGHFLPAITLDSVALMRRVVLETDAVSWAPPAMIEAGLTDGTLVAFPFQEPWTRLNYGIIRRTDRPSTPAIDTFLSVLRATEARLTAPRRAPPLRPTRAGDGRRGRR